MAPPAEPAKVAQLDRSAVDMVNFGRWPLVTADAAAAVLCQHLLVEFVAQSWPGVCQVESKEGDHVGGDDQRSQRVCAAAIAYRLPDVADLLGLLAAVFRAEADVLLSNLGRVERLKAAGAQPNPPLLLHEHRARLLPCNRTKHLCCEQPTRLCATAASARQLCQYPIEGCWQRWAEGHGCVANIITEKCRLTNCMMKRQSNKTCVAFKQRHSFWRHPSYYSEVYQISRSLDQAITAANDAFLRKYWQA